MDTGLEQRPDLAEAVERARSSRGWSLDVSKRDLDGPPPWDYEDRARQVLSNSRAAVDLGTGGGEVLSRVAGADFQRCAASEQWHVNAPVAAARLRPLGIDVVHAS